MGSGELSTTMNIPRPFPVLSVAVLALTRLSATTHTVTTIDNDTAAAVMDAIRSLVPDVTFAMVGTHDFVAEPLYRELTQFTDHWVQLNEMETSLPLTGLDAGTVKIVARHPEIATADLYRILQVAALEGVEVTHSLAPFVEMSAAGVTTSDQLAQLVER